MAVVALQVNYEFPKNLLSKEDIIRDVITMPLLSHRKALNVVWFTARTWREAHVLAYLACKKIGLKTTRSERYYVCNEIAIQAQQVFTSNQVSK